MFNNVESKSMVVMFERRMDIIDIVFQLKYIVVIASFCQEASSMTLCRYRRNVPGLQCKRILINVAYFPAMWRWTATPTRAE